MELIFTRNNRYANVAVSHLNQLLIYDWNRISSTILSFFKKWISVTQHTIQNWGWNSFRVPFFPVARVNFVEALLPLSVVQVIPHVWQNGKERNSCRVAFLFGCLSFHIFFCLNFKLSLFLSYVSSIVCWMRYTYSEISSLYTCMKHQRNAIIKY